MDDFNPEEMREFQENLTAMNAAMGPLARALSGLAGQINANTGERKESTQAHKDHQEIIKGTSKMSIKMGLAEKSTQQSLELFDAAIIKSVQGVESFSKAVLTGGEGLSKYGDGLRTLGEGASLAGAAFGPLGFAIGKTIEVLTKVAGVMLNQTDAQNAFVKELNLMGAIVGTNSNKLTDLARDAGYHAAALQDLLPILQSSTQAMALFGSGVSDGTAKTLKMLALTDEEERQMRRYGYTLEEAQEGQMAYMELQRVSGIATRQKDFDELKMRKSSLEYTKSLVLLSELTGKQSAQLKAEQKQVADEMQNRLMNIKIQMEINDLTAEATRLRKAGNIQDAEQMEAKVKMLQKEEQTRAAALLQFTTTMGPAFSTQLQRAMRTGAFDTSTGAQAMMGFNPADLKAAAESIQMFVQKEDTDASSSTYGEMIDSDVKTKEYNDFIASTEQQFKDGIERQIKHFADSGQLMGEEAEAFYRSVGLTKETVDAYLLMDKDRAGQLAIINKGLEDATQEGADAQKDVATEFQVVERNIRTAADEIVDSFNIFNGALTASSIAIGAFTLALGVASASMMGIVRMGGKGGIASLLAKFGIKGGGGAGAGAGATVGKGVLKTGARAIPGVGTAVAVGAALYGGYATADEAKQAADQEYLTKSHGATPEGKIKLKQERDDKIKQGNVTGGYQAAGGAGGALAGAATGAALGSLAGPIGTLIGGMIGAAAGAYMGGKLGKELGKSEAELAVMTSEEREAHEAKKEIANKQAEIQQKTLDEMVDSGIYDKDWLGDSEVDLYQLAQMRDDGELTHGMLDAMLADGDLSQENVDALTTLKGQIPELIDVNKDGNALLAGEEEEESKESRFADWSNEKLDAHFNALSGKETELIEQKQTALEKEIAEQEKLIGVADAYGEIVKDNAQSLLEADDAQKALTEEQKKAKAEEERLLAEASGGADAETIKEAEEETGGWLSEKFSEGMNWLNETGRSVRDGFKETTSYIAENTLEGLRGKAGYDDNYADNEARDAELAKNDGKTDLGEKWAATDIKGIAGDIVKATLLGPIGMIAGRMMTGETDAIATTGIVNATEAVTPEAVEGLGLDEINADVLGTDGTTTETVAQLTSFEQESLKKQDELNRLQAEANRIAKEGVDNTEKIATYANI